jgi:arylsulfatase A-like enzyme
MKRCSPSVPLALALLSWGSTPGCETPSTPSGPPSAGPTPTLRVDHLHTELDTIAMGEEARRGFLLTPSLSRRIELQVPEGAPVLHLAYGTWTPEGAAWSCDGPVSLGLGIAAPGGTGSPEPLERISLTEDLGYHRAWTELDLPLEAWAGRSVQLHVTLDSQAAGAAGGSNCFVALGDLAVVTGPEEPPSAPDIWFIVIDTLRYDHLGHVSPGLVDTPAIDALAQRAVRFTEARSPSSYTVETMISTFAGDYVFLDTPVRSYVAPSDGRRWHPSVVERLAGAGYRTLGLYANRAVGRGSSMDAGFESYRYVLDAGMPEALDRVIAQQDPRRPRFVYLHLMSPHDPYEYHEGITPRYLEDLGVQAEPGTSLAQPDLEQAAGRDPQRENLARALYRGEVSFSDRVVGELLERLAEQRQEREIWLFLTSDHGEELWDHGGVGHARTLFDEVIHVPLLVEPPPGSADIPVGVELDAPVSNIDLAHSWLELAGLEDGSRTAGRSLLPLLRGEPFPPGRVRASTLFNHGPIDITAMLRDGRKLLLYREPARAYYPASSAPSLRGSGLPLDLLDLRADPRELAPLGPEQAGEPQQELAAFLQLATHGSAVLRLDLPAGVPGELTLELQHDGPARAWGSEGLAVAVERGEQSVTLRVNGAASAEPAVVRVELAGLTERDGMLGASLQLDGRSLGEARVSWPEGAQHEGAGVRIPGLWDRAPSAGTCGEGAVACVTWDPTASSLPFHFRLPESMEERLRALGYVE